MTLYRTGFLAVPLKPDQAINPLRNPNSSVRYKRERSCDKNSILTFNNSKHV
jgi:hypothetical protein